MNFLTTPLIVIVGETASGKSALAMDLARRFNGELICADATTVYCGFDIGSAKPSEKDRAEVPHHLLDVAGAEEGFTAARFKQLADRATIDISARGKLPIMVGGSGLYIDSVLYDYQFKALPNTDERDVLNTMSLADLLVLAHERGLDTSSVDTANSRRVVRLIETNGVHTKRSELRPNTCVLGVQINRELLRSQVKKRVAAMLEAGLENEVKTLASRYGWSGEAMKAIGYREWQSYFAGQATLEQTADRIVTDTMRLAKKQRTWFQRNNSIQWVSDPKKAVDIVTTFLNN